WGLSITTERELRAPVQTSFGSASYTRRAQFFLPTQATKCRSRKCGKKLQRFGKTDVSFASGVCAPLSKILESDGECQPAAAVNCQRACTPRHRARKIFGVQSHILW